MAAPKKQYGLILPKKMQQKFSNLPKHAAFADDSDEEVSVGESLQKEALKKRVMKQTKLEMQKALEEDATVYEYDSIYGDLQRKKEESNTKQLSGKDKKPKYIQSLMKAVEMRKNEQERRMERKIQKERETEGEEFKDKEAFVTSAYKKKLQERAEEDERDRREAALEASLDVTKQKDLSGFYRHLLKQTVGEEKTPECSLRDVRVKEEKVKGYADELNQRSKSPSEIKESQTVKQEDNPDADSDLESDSSSESEDEETQKSNQALAGRKNLVSSDEDSSHNKEKDPRGKENHSHREQKKSRRKGDGAKGCREKDEEHEDQSAKDHRKEKEERSSHRHYRKGEEQENKRRKRARKESSHSSKKHKKERDRNNKDGRSRERKEKYQDKDRERNEKHREKTCSAKDEERERSEKPQEREERSSLPSENERQPGGDKDETLDTSQNPQTSASLSGLLETKRKAAEEGSRSTEKVPANVNKFAKRSNEETVLSARDRYLARQMARVSSKTYIEKEED